MAIFLYHLFLFIYSLAAKLISPWTPKAKQWVNGRKNWREKMSGEWAVVNSKTINHSPLTTTYSPFTIWMRCASLGEFEQGRPVLHGRRPVEPDQDCRLLAGL